MTDENFTEMIKKITELIKIRNGLLSPVLPTVSVVLLSSFFSCKKNEAPVIPVVETTAISAVTQTTASGGGKVVDNGGLPIISRGVCWSFSDNPTILDRKTSDGKGDGLFTSNLTDLSPQSQYYVRAYATNSIGTGYGESVTFNTSPVGLCEVTTAEVTELTSNSAKSGGNVISGGGGSVTGRGVCWSTKTGPVITGNDNKTSDYSGTGAFVSNITGLQPNQTYYVRAYATNMAGVAYGNERSFTTPADMPKVTTSSITSYTSSSAVVGGEVTSDGGATVTERGVCWSTAPNPSISNDHRPVGSGTGSFSTTIDGLAERTTYHVRAYASNSSGTAYGDDKSFTTASASVTDGDGNTYRVIQIGTQYWLSENLRTTKYNDGTAIPLVTDGSTWGALTSPAYCWYNNDAAGYGATYGALYNWYTVSSAANGGKNICPVGWHVPTDTEWTTLTTYLGGLAVAGGKLKETGTTHWTSPNTGATNSSGFTALPGGYRTTSFSYIGQRGYWWSSTESNPTNGIYRSLVYNQASVTTGNIAKTRGCSVRCIKD